ncbi:MAG: hypothetical protein K5777_02405 [Nitrosopumilus sp.]|nr:hypothetical protein [Nitrosopumilus sp.]
MNSKIIGISIVIATIIVSGATVLSYQEVQSEKFKVHKEKIYDSAWDEETTKILPRETDLGEGWILMWSDSTEKFVQGENPIITKKTIAGNEIFSTSYIYAHEDYGTYQILIWKGELVSNWIPKETIENIFVQTDAKTKKILEGLDLIPNCIVGYYDYYGDESEIKNELLFSECAKKDYRVRVNLVEGEYSQESIEKIVFLSNFAIGKI